MSDPLPVATAALPDQIFSGSCHCQAIQFRVQVKRFQVLDCNCSICQKKGFLHLIVPADQFELFQGQEALQTYTFNTGIAQHYFCRTCGIAPFYRPRSHPDCFDINLRCIDDAPLAELLPQFELKSFDGRAWEQNVTDILA
jgi:hypothetical protein